MTFDSLDALVRPLALVGLLIGTTLYSLLIRRRRRRRDDAAARDSEASRRRAAARFRRLQRRDEP